MAQSIKRRMAASHVGKMTDREIRQLFSAILTDVRAVAADLANVQIVTNNLVSAVTNIDVNCSNATVNLNSVTLVAVSNAALTLTT